MKPTLDYALAMAASRDAGERSRRAAGRERWSVEDYDAACAEFARLVPDPLTASASITEEVS